MRFFKKWMIIWVLLLAGSHLYAAENTVSKLGLDVQCFTLNNGMLFLVVERHATPQVACRIAIRAGSALETERTGLAHMLEHMMFKGTKNFGTMDVQKDQALQQRIEAAYQAILAEKNKRNPDQELIATKRRLMNELRMEVQEIYVPHAFSAQLEKNGARGVNAFTSQDQTQYIASIPSDMLAQWFSIISEQLFEPAWREFYVEREVVQREWAFRYVNNPQGAAFLDLYATAFKAHPYHNPVIGWKSDIERLTTTDAMQFHKTYYNPTNAVCVLVGDVTPAQVKSFAEVYFERYPDGPQAPERVTREPPQGGPRKNIRILKGARTPLARVGFHSARMGTPDFYALDVLSSVLSEGRSARMTQNITEKGLAVNAWGYNPDHRYAGLFILGGSPVESGALKDKDLSEAEKHALYVKDCENLEDLLLAELEKLKTELLTERELARVKKMNERSFLDRMRHNEQLAGMLATLEVQVGWQYLTHYLENLAAVTPEQLRDAAARYFRPENRTSVYVIPGGTPEEPPEQYTEIRSADRAALERTSQSHDLTNHSEYPTPQGWKHPLSFERRPEKTIYPEADMLQVADTTVYYMKDTELPLIDLFLLIPVGEVDVDAEKQGLADLLNGSIIRGGTKNYSPAALARALDENGIHLGISMQEEQTVVALSVIKPDWGKALELLAEVLTRPRFDKEKLAVVRQQAMTALRRQGGDAMRVCMREAKIHHFNGHPYGKDPLNALDTIPNITRKDLQDFIKTHWVPSNMTVALAGDIERSGAVSGLEGLFQFFSKNTPPERRLSPPVQTPPFVALIHKPGQVQSKVCMTLPGVKRTHPAYWKLNLLMDVLGGSGSLMYTRLRDDLGLIYAGGFFQSYKWEAGLLMGYIGCRGDKTREAVMETVRIMQGLRKSVPEKRIEQKRLDVLNGFVFNVDTPAALVKTYATYDMRGEPLDTLEKIQEAFITAEKQELESLAKKFLEPEKLQIFVVGDKDTEVNGPEGQKMSLEADIKALAEALDLPYEEIPLR